MIIRAATLDDVPALVRLSSMMHAESAYSKFEFIPAKMEFNFINWISDPGSWFVCVAESSEKQIIGAYCGYITEYMFGSDILAYDMGLFVDPSKRGGMAAIRLIKAFENWAQFKNAKEVCPGTTTMVASDRTSKLYEKLGYKVVGSIFKKEV